MERASWAAEPAVVVAGAGLTAVPPSAGAGLALSLEIAVIAVLAALVVEAGETEAAAADGGCGEASAAFLVSRDQGSGGRCLPKRQRGHPERIAPTTSCTWAWRSILVFQTCINVLRDT